VTKTITLIGALLFLCSCASTQVTRIQPLSESADTPYGNVLVVSLFESFDIRRYLEKDIVKQLEELGVKAVASTSLMDTRTPVTRETFLAMVESLRSDSVLVTQLVDLETEGKLKDARPQSTYNVSPTYYFNVWNVELTEYVAPQQLQLKHSLVLATQLYSVAAKKPVWGIESKTKITMNYDERGDTSIITKEAKTITSYLSRDGLLGP
jgi:hypothetical protein